VRPLNGLHLTVEDVQENVILGDDIHQAPTKIISLENTLGGTIIPVEEIKKISEFARSNGIIMHLDGARLWNASIATGVSIKEYAQYFDTVSLCLSKGLGAPVGSILVGPQTKIDRANWLKKQAGGGIRQAGLLTAAADVAVEEVWPTMAVTHAKTAKLAKDLEAIGIYPQIPVHTNFFFIDGARSELNIEIFKQEAAKHNVKVLGERLVLHHQVTDAAIANLKLAIASALKLSKLSSANKTSGEETVSAYSRQRMNGNLDRVL
jgi:threonine aldolase